jgi:hypothetical protein
MIVEERMIAGHKVTLYSKDGKNFSSNPADLDPLEASAASVEAESPFWEDKKVDDEPEASYEQF